MYSFPPSLTRTALYFRSDENWISSRSSASAVPYLFARASTVRFLLPVVDANTAMRCSASTGDTRSHEFS